VAHLVLTVDGVDHVFPLAGVVRIGRHPENDIQVLDAQVSKRHCELEEHVAGWVLRDLGTLNGTYVNGERVRGETLLCHRDTIRVGERTLVYSDLADAPVAQPSLEPRPIVSSVATTSAGGVGALSPAERDRLLHEYLKRILAAPSRDRLLETALDALLSLAEADAGLILAKAGGEPFDGLEGLEIAHWRGRGRELPALRDWAELATGALRGGRLIVRVHSSDETYRIWEPRCTLIAPLGFGERWLALVAIGCPGEQPESLREIELCARVTGAVLAALGS
jgi:pSer/pThr/pTyr-binding forkhead associated (FHA) protein